MYICEYVYIYISIYVYLYMYICIYAFKHLCIYVYILVLYTSIRIYVTFFQFPRGDFSNSVKKHEKHQGSILLFWFPAFWDTVPVKFFLRPKSRFERFTREVLQKLTLWELSGNLYNAHISIYPHIHMGSTWAPVSSVLHERSSKN